MEVDAIVVELIPNATARVKLEMKIGFWRTRLERRPRILPGFVPETGCAWSFCGTSAPGGRLRSC